MSWWWNSNPASSRACGSNRTDPSSSGAIGLAAGRRSIPGHVEERRPRHELAEGLGEVVVGGRLGQRDVDRSGECVVLRAEDHRAHPVVGGGDREVLVAGPERAAETELEEARACSTAGCGGRAPEPSA